MPWFKLLKIKNVHQLHLSNTLPACLKFCIYTTIYQWNRIKTKIFDMFKIMTLKKQKFSLSDPILIRQFSKKLQSDPVLLRPKFATVLIRAHLCCLVLTLSVLSIFTHPLLLTLWKIKGSVYFASWSNRGGCCSWLHQVELLMQAQENDGSN